jgi:hypothetical protein
MRIAKGNLKKQSQFVPTMIGVTPYSKGDYDRIPLCGVQENKANSKFTLSGVEWANLFSPQIHLGV